MNITKRKEAVKMEKEPQEHKTPVIQLILSWAFVGIPLAWGISMTVIKAMKLFK